MIKTEYNIRGSADITIAVVADLHERKPDQVLEILRDVQPDVIAVPGDLLENYDCSSYSSYKATPKFPYREFLKTKLGNCGFFFSPL